MIDLLPLEPRREPKRSGRVRRGAHKPLAIRWFGMTALAGHLRHLLAVAAASNQLDLRDWMRPEEAAGLLNRVCQVLGASAHGGSLAERLGREVWIDFVADTGDDHDVSLAVGRMLFAEYALSGDQPRRLPRGDILVFGGDVAYPASTAYEVERRLLRPWNQRFKWKGGGWSPPCSARNPGQPRLVRRPRRLRASLPEERPRRFRRADERLRGGISRSIQRFVLRARQRRPPAPAAS